MPGHPPSADALWADLVAVLEDLIREHQQLLDVLQREKRLMVEGDVDALLPSLTDKEKILERVRAIERRRRELVDALASRAGRPADTASLTRLAALAPEPYAEALRSCHARLEALAASMVELNQLNGVLVDRILTRVTSLLALIRHVVVDAPLYQSSGLPQDAPPGGRTLGRG